MAASAGMTTARSGADEWTEPCGGGDSASVWCAVRVPVCAGRIAASTAAVGSGRRRSAPVVGPRTRDLWSHNRRRAVARATGTTTAAVAANGGGGGPSSVVRWCLVAVSVLVEVVAVVGSPPSHTTRVPTSVGHPYRRRAVVARPAAAPSTGAQRNRHGNRSPLPLTNPFGTADRPLTPRAPAHEHTTTAAARSVVAAYHTHAIVSTLFHTRASRRRHFLVTRDFFQFFIIL
ncbi:hypothetical protein QTP88_014797 [Uroleucon formosanum]